MQNEADVKRDADIDIDRPGSVEVVDGEGVRNFSFIVV